MQVTARALSWNMFDRPKAGLTATAFAAATLVANQATAESHDPVTVSHGYSTFGELKYDANFERLDYVNPDAPKGGEISISTDGTFDSFNQFTRKGRFGALSSIGFENILIRTADDPTALYCLLCETLEYPESRDWVVFNLRPEVTFVDGSPLLAEDIEFTFELFMEQGLPSFRAAFGSIISGIDVLDSHKVRFNFTPDSPVRDRISLAGGFPAFSQKWYSDTGARLDESRLEPGLGTGPYQLESYDINRRIVYARNPDYWGKDLPINVGRDNFDNIRVEYFADSAAAFEGFKTGAYTFRNELSSKQWATGYDFPALSEGWVVKEELNDGNLSSGQSFVFNLRRDKFKDIRVREAIGMMFNFEWSNEKLFYGLYARTDSFWGNSDMMATGTPTDSEVAILQPLVDQGLLDASILTDEALLPPISSTRQLDRGLLRAASKLLDEAGWTIGASGKREKDGEILTVEFLETSPLFDRIINPYIQNLERLGVDARLNRVDYAQGTQRERDYDFDMTTHSFSLGLEPSTGLKQWFGTEAMDESSRNLMGLSDPAVDALIEVIVAAKSKTELRDAVRAMDRVLRSKQFWVPQWFKDKHTVAYFDMYGRPDELPPFSRGELDFWWFDADKAKALKAAGAFR